VANESRIVNALITAAKNGKKVTVFVELKARFDEANNIKWSKKMKAAGVQIIESIPGLKVHAKLALIKKKSSNGTRYFGFLATGNFNEQTAKFYTDHALLTANEPMLKEVERLFLFLKKRRRPTTNEIVFKNLLVGQFNLQEQFISLIDNEIDNCKKGQKSGLIIKLNNLDEEVLIKKLYEASCAGVKISLIIRGICTLVPGVKGMSENIGVVRIVDRYLEHSRIFIFSNNAKPLVYLGSSDWMNRNIYRRIEVCFPVVDKKLSDEIVQVVNLQLLDNVQAVAIDQHGSNKVISSSVKKDAKRSQQEIGKFLLDASEKTP
jgi:polyphosphate kinase